MNNLYQTLKAKYPSAKLLITGHSLGGAVASIFAAELYSKYSAKIDYFYTFETPRVGNSNFANYMKNISPNSYRITHYSDIVVHVFQEQTREFYRLEDLWGDAEIRTIKN